MNRRVSFAFEFTNLKVTMYAGVVFRNVKSGIREKTAMKREYLSLQSTKQSPFIASRVPEVLLETATQAQLE